MSLDPDVVVAQLNDLLSQFERLGGRGDLFLTPESDLNAAVMRMVAAVSRIAPHSSYASEVAATSPLRKTPIVRLPLVAGVVQALRDDVAAGHLQTVAELLHADTFADFLGMATELLAKSYKDPAAVVAGAVLEAHLRLLCEKTNTTSTLQPNGKPKKADTMNADLTKEGVYNAIVQKQVTSWLGIRNAAAHGEFDKFTAEDARLLIAGVSDFLLRHPA